MPHCRMATSTRRILPVVVALGLVLAACGSTRTSRDRDPNNNVSFNGCGSVACTGSINGAPYEIVLPTKWNGTLLLYSHGYRNAAPTPPDFTPVNTKAEPAPGWSSGKKDVGNALLAQGFALAGSAYKSNGWAVEDGVKADEDLYAFFNQSVGSPNRVYVWGDSLGGLITQTVAEKDPSWVSGVAPFCGALAGLIPNLDLALDVEYGVKTLIYPELQLTGYATYEDAVKNWEGAAKAVIAAAADTAGGGTAKVLYLGALVDGPGKTKTYDGSTIQSTVKATVESILTAVGYGTFGRYDIEQRYGGNVSSNDGVDYSARISVADTALIDAVTAGAVASANAAMAGGTRVTADAASVEKARATGCDPKGVVVAPTITMHTAADPLVIVQNESFFRNRYAVQAAAGRSTADLVQYYTVPPAIYSEATGAPFGAGHCNFTADTRVAVIGLLDQWVKQGVTPSGGSAAAVMPAATTGFTPIYAPGPWPEPALVAASTG